MFAGVGERTQEGNDLYKEMIESGVIKLGEKQVHCITLYFKVGLSGQTTCMPCGSTCIKSLPCVFRLYQILKGSILLSC